MRRTAVLLASMALAVLLACGAALAEEKLDQANAGPWESPYHYKEFNSDFQHLAQVFTGGKRGELSKVSVRISKVGIGACGGDINVRIYSMGTTSTNLTTLSDPIASTTIPATQVPRLDSTYWWTLPWTEVTFDSGNRPTVFAGYKYAVALEPVSSGSDAQCSYRWYYNDGGHYTGGTGHYHRIDTPGMEYPWESWYLDFLFKTYVDVPDSDGDGIADDVDQCDYEPGPASTNG